jgi:hypothetical protein
MKNFKTKHIDEMDLDDFLSLEINRALYKEFNATFKPYFKDEGSLDFFKYIYRDTVFFNSRYLKTPYEVDEFLNNKYREEGRSPGLSIKREIVYELARLATLTFIWNDGDDRYIPFNTDNFISGRHFPKLIYSDFHRTVAVAGHHVWDFLDANCTHHKLDKYKYNYTQIADLKEFLNHIEILERPNEQINKNGMESIKMYKYFPKSFRLVQEVAKLGLEKTKQLYQAKNFKVLVNNIFENEYKSYIEKDRYFPGCPLSIYKKAYQKRLENYLSIYPDADEFDFLEEEEATMSQIIEMEMNNKNNFYSFYKGLYERPHQKNLKMSAEKARDFIDNKITDLGHNFKVNYQRFHPLYLPDPLDIPDLPREYWVPERILNVESDIENNTDIQSEFSAKSTQNVNPTNKEIKSLRWSSADYSELNQIHKSLKDNGYINCDLTYFKRSFSGIKDFEKIKWLQADYSLIYFYGRLIDRNKVIKPSKKWMKFKEVFEYSGSSAASLYSQCKNETKNLPDKLFFDTLIK